MFLLSMCLLRVCNAAQLEFTVKEKDGKNTNEVMLEGFVRLFQWSSPVSGVKA